jgi:hypothetical protein
MQLPDVFATAFATTVCKACGLCSTSGNHTDPSPAHCLIIFNADREGFKKMLKYLAEVKKKDIVKYMQYLAFDGFCGLFCNNWCPCGSDQCEDLAQRIECYSEFVNQAHLYIALETKAKLFERYSGIDVHQIGLAYRPMKVKLDKREKKSVMRTIQRAMSAFSNNKKFKKMGDFKQQTPPKEIKVKKKVSTLFFFREDDLEWAAIIRKRLGEEETTVEQT